MAADDRARFVVWVGMLCVALLVYCTLHASQARAEAYAEYKRRQIAIVTGTVLAATPDTLIVIYPGPNDVETTKTFAGSSSSPPPEIGASVLVSWNRARPDDAYVMPIR